MPENDYIEQVPIQRESTYVKKPLLDTGQRRINIKENKMADEVANEILQEAAIKKRQQIGGRQAIEDLPLEPEHPELWLVPAAAEIKAAGLVPGMFRFAAGTVTGNEVGKRSTNIGQKIDSKLGTSIFAPTFGFIGGLGGYAFGSGFTGNMLSRIPRKYSYGPTNERTYWAEDQTPSASQLEIVPQAAFAKNPDIRYAMSENGLEGVRQRWFHTIIHPNHFYDKPDLEYAGIPKGDRNFKFKTMRFRMTPGESEAAQLWSKKRNIWDRYKTVTKRRGLKFNEYDEPVVPIVSSVSDTKSFDDPIFAQSNLVKVFQQYGGKNLLSESELKFKPEELQQGWIDYFNSPQYRARVRQNSGLSEPEIDRFINEMITNMKSAHHTYMTLPQIVEKKVPAYNPATGDFSIKTVLAQGSEGGHYEPHRHLVVINNSRGKYTPVNFEHEDLHATLRPGTYPREVLDKSGLINGTVLNQTNGIRGMILPGERLTFSNGLVEKPSFAQRPFNKYLAGRDEARVRGLKILRYLDEHNLPITEENVGKVLDEMDAYDANQLSSFTRESVIDYLKKLYALPISVGLGATALNKNQNK